MTLSRKEAKEQGLVRYFTGKSCKHGHIAERQVANGCCLTCNSLKARKYHADNRDKILEQQRVYRIENRDRLKSELSAWKSANRARCTALEVKRYAAKMKRTPPWLTDSHNAEILGFYEKSARLTAETGIKHHVDHIHPLQGKAVSGLHVPWNLQVLTATENQSKGNR